MAIAPSFMGKKNQKKQNFGHISNKKKPVPFNQEYKGML
jgi:hypothetical protein